MALFTKAPLGLQGSSSPPHSQAFDILSDPIKYHLSSSSDLSKGIRKSAREEREEGGAKSDKRKEKENARKFC
jgi:hypothetical protein